MCIVRNRPASIAAPHEVERFQHSSGMIPVSVGQHNALDDAQIDAEPPGIALELPAMQASSTGCNPLQLEALGQNPRQSTKTGRPGAGRYRSGLIVSNRTDALASTERRRLTGIFIGPPRDVKDPAIFHSMSLVAFLAWVGLGSDG